MDRIIIIACNQRNVYNTLSSEQNPEECDATDDDSSNAARLIIFFFTIFHFFGLIFVAYGKRFE
jgi:hypothetical protein